MTCRCNPKSKPMSVVTESTEQNRYLTEGCCPNRCGPLTRQGERVASCSCCGLIWTSLRVINIWPSKDGKV